VLFVGETRSIGASSGSRELLTEQRNERAAMEDLRIVAFVAGLVRHKSVFLLSPEVIAFGRCIILHFRRLGN
jgi:hypothetical protein